MRIGSLDGRTVLMTDAEAIVRDPRDRHGIETMVARAAEVAGLARFLASDDAAFNTGASYVIDGGAPAWRGIRA